jgi:hypothetical protein
MADRIDHWKEVGWRNAVVDQFNRMRHQYPDWQAEFIAHAREYGQKFWPELQQEQDRGLEHER